MSSQDRNWITHAWWWSLKFILLGALTFVHFIFGYVMENWKEGSALFISAGQTAELEIKEEGYIQLKYPWPPFYTLLSTTFFTKDTKKSTYLRCYCGNKLCCVVNRLFFFLHDHLMARLHNHTVCFPKHRWRSSTRVISVTRWCYFILFFY